MTITTMTIRGVARNTNWHEQRSSVNSLSAGEPVLKISYLLTFQLEVTDKFGNILGYKAVEFTANQIRNICAEGDDVEVMGSHKESNILCAEKIKNLNTSAEIICDKERSFFAIFFEIVAAAILLLAVGYAIYFAINLGR